MTRSLSPAAFLIALATCSALAAPPATAPSTVAAKPAPVTAPFDEAKAKTAQKSWADYVGTKTQITNSVGAALALIPPGTFTMGTPADEPGRYKNETPHKVTLTKAFVMGTTPVTQGQWKALMGNNPSSDIHGFGENFPVNTVSWNEAVDFCKKLSKKEGKSYRLPTEAEWEYACRAGTTTEYYTGNGADSLKKAGWYDGNSRDESHALGFMHAVGQKAANSFGLYDMHGNQNQWCTDWFAEQYVEEDQTDPTSAATGKFRVLRGGTWKSDLEDCRAGFRVWDQPNTRDFFNGFRLVMDVQ